MGVVIVEGEAAVLRVNLGRPIVTNGDSATRLYPNDYGEDLFVSGVDVRAVVRGALSYIEARTCIRFTEVSQPPETSHISFGLGTG